MSLAISVPSGNLTSSFIEKLRKTFKQEKVILLPEKEYKEMLKAKRKAEYLAKLDKSFEQIKEGKTTTFTMDELEAMSK